PVFPDLAVAEVRPMDVQLLQARLRARVSQRTGKPVSEKTVHCVVSSSLRAMIRDARVQDLIVRDPFVGLTWKSLEPPPADPFAPEGWTQSIRSTKRVTDRAGMIRYVVSSGCTRSRASVAMRKGLAASRS